MKETLVIISLLDKTVQQFNLKAINKIDISNFHAGVYVIHIQDHPQIVTRVVIE
ncbi:MAG: T9SS type A sorting domain-containing protein [Saprospiraceae bacterium]|nr:T9SS type A sorting domain-containing protein [Candidatus Defluviibacterium haderslevense]